LSVPGRRRLAEPTPTGFRSNAPLGVNMLEAAAILVTRQELAQRQKHASEGKHDKHHLMNLIVAVMINAS